MKKIVVLQRRKEINLLTLKKFMIIIVMSAMIPILVPVVVDIQDKVKEKEILVQANNSSITNEKVREIGEWKKNVQIEIIQLREAQKLLYEKYNNELKDKERKNLMKIDNEIEYNNIKTRVLEYRLNNEIMEDEIGWESRALNNIMKLAKENTVIMKDIDDMEERKNLEKEYNKYKKNFMEEKKMRVTTMKKYWTSLEQREPIMEDETKIINLNSSEFLKIAIISLGMIIIYGIIESFRKKVLIERYY